MPDRTLVQELAAFAVAARHGGLPREVGASAQQRMLDIVGVQLAALPLETSGAVLAHVAEQGGAGQASAVGLPDPVPSAWAAFANGVLAHSLDYDDTHLPSILHPSASVVPAALAAAEQAGSDAASVLAAVAVGVEVTVRLGMAGYDRNANDSVYFANGQHATSICGTVGAAAAAALTLELDQDSIAEAMAISTSMAAGIIEANRTGGTVKRLHCGWAAHAGVTAAQLAARGITGAPTALEGRFGFFQAFLHGLGVTDEITDGLGERWALPTVFLKPYPANHFTHTGLDAARRMREWGLHAADVETATLRVASPTVRTIGEPLDVKQRPETGYQAQFSGPYAVAVGLFGGGGLGANLHDYTDALARDPDRRALMARVTVRGDEECDRIYPYQFPSILEIETVDGQRLVEKVPVNRGGSDDPLTDAEVALKFRDNAAVALKDADVDAIQTHLATFGDAPLHPLMAVLRGAER